MTERVKKCLDFLKSDKGYIPASGVYCLKSDCGDEMTTIYNEDGITVDVCYDWDYIEVLGLSTPEFLDLQDNIYKGNK